MQCGCNRTRCERQEYHTVPTYLQDGDFLSRVLPISASLYPECFFAAEKLHVASCGFVRVVIFRRSRASGLLFRVAESPTQSWDSAYEGEICKWPLLSRPSVVDLAGGANGLLSKEAQDGENDKELGHPFKRSPLLRYLTQTRVVTQRFIFFAVCKGSHFVYSPWYLQTRFTAAGRLGRQNQLVLFWCRRTTCQRP